MPSTPHTSPVEDSVPKINNELAVGSDVEFQHRWQHLERAAWIVLTLFLVLSIAGVFGRGPVANASAQASDRSMVVKYERIQRFGTPSVLTIQLHPSAIRDRKVQLWVSESLTKPLGTQRVVPQPLQSEIGGGGILYTFPASTSPASVEFQTQPSRIGLTNLTLQIPGRSAVPVKIFVVP